MGNNRNLILAFALSALVLFGLQYFVAMPQMKADQARQAALTKQEKSKPASPPGAPWLARSLGAGLFDSPHNGGVFLAAGSAQLQAQEGSGLLIQEGDELKGPCAGNDFAVSLDDLVAHLNVLG